MILVLKSYLLGMLFLITMCVNCYTVSCWKRQTIADPQSKVLGVVPVEPGIFVEDIALSMLDSCVWRYLKDNTVFSDVCYINAAKSEKTQVVDIVNGKENVFRFKIPEDTLVDKCDVLLVISNVWFSSSGFGDELNIIVPIPLPLPIPVIPLFNFGTVKISDDGQITGVKCGYDYLLWDIHSRTKIAYGRIDGRLNKSGYFNTTMSDNKGRIALFDTMLKKLSIERN
jgi:hypothetical protein